MKPNFRVKEPIIARRPPVYLCYRAKEKLNRIDGDLEKTFWQNGEWITEFHDIEGDSRPLPSKNTRVKVLWDEEALYIAAELRDDTIWTTVTERDKLIFIDNDFEVFLDPQGNGHRYYELEMNAHNAVWDLLMEKPQRDIVHRIISWDIKGLESAVKVQGSLNDPSADNQFWSLELKIPWFSLRECAEDECYPTRTAPLTGEIWHMNFSRVEYDVDIVDNQYRKRKNPQTGLDLPEHNWVWAPTGVIDIHMPEMWGYLIFTDNGEHYPLPSEDIVKSVLFRLYYREHAFSCRHGHFTSDVRDLMGDCADEYALEAYTTPSMFEGIAHWNSQTWHIRQDGYVWREDS